MTIEIQAGEIVSFVPEPRKPGWWSILVVPAIIYRLRMRRWRKKLLRIVRVVSATTFEVTSS